MDVGVFLRSKTRLRLWLILPPVVLAVLGGAGWTFAQRMDQDMKWRQEFLETAPELRAMLQNALSVASNAYMTARGGSEARERLSTLFNDIARQSGFTVNSLTIDEATGRAKGLQALVKGDGTLDRVLRFIEASERPETLVSLDSGSFMSMRPVVNPPYQVEMRFLYSYSPK